ncbi:MAG: exodeoxyribonuclease VII large subunit [Firmicutes bacterium]|nr:exodeoxyribonuclease VII large subunit [Bacillota bacterium]
MEREPLSVSELNARIKGLIESDPVLGSVYVRGELSNYKVYPSGHHYFTLKDAESSLRCVMFRSAASKLRFRPESGMRVTAWGRVAVYPRDGAYQLYCEGLMPEGAGDLQVAYEQLKAKLAAERLFDPAHKKPIPHYPERIAVITSSAGAAVHDIIRVLRKRWPVAKVVLLPVRVQGVEAPPEIAGALRYANKYRVADVIITGRGGGSIEDLWAFNDERVARAIYASELPVISAVGHEPDVTIADFVADLRAATPSNAAELVAPDVSELRDAIRSASARLDQAIGRGLSQRRTALTELASRRVMQSPTGFIDQRRLELDSIRLRLDAAATGRLHRERQEFARLAAKLDALSPLKVLGRGYSIALDAEGRAVREAAQLKAGDKLDLRLSRGGAKCLVESIYGGEDNGCKEKDL